MEVFCRFFFDEQKSGAPVLFSLLHEKLVGMYSYFPRLTSYDEIDSYEYRGERIPAKKQNSLEFRIFILGGSAAYGLGVEDLNSTYFKVFENFLNKNNPYKREVTYKVISAAMVGINSAQELVLLNSGILQFEPDLFIIYDGYNDIYTLSGAASVPGYSPGFTRSAIILKSSPFTIALRRLYVQSSLLKSLGKLFKTTIIEKQLNKIQKDPIMHQNIARHYERNLDNMCVLLKSYEVKTILALQPSVIDKRKKTEFEATYSNHLPYGAELAETLQVIYPFLKEALVKVGKRNNVLTFDFRGIYDDVSEEVYLDMVHQNEYGQKILGKAFFDRFSSFIYKERESVVVR
jgi:hypothetical protein